ncbi:MAG: hypothetical protein GC186_13630 [Rhodobacteraceae bacterium]|nr:hypothetical protein [Paracoccaceae bacterium]
MAEAARPADDPAAALLRGYAPVSGIADELMDAEGRVRPVWHPFVSYLGGQSREEIATRVARGDQYLRDAGVFTRLYADGGSTERAWPLSAVPVILHESDWAEITTGLRQRADLLEAVVRDLYGPGRLVTEGHLPAALVAGNPEWLRPLVGVEPRGGHFLHFVAFELGRSPDGSWFVLGDRTQAPSGAGFALENRVATSRVFSDFYPEANVERLAPFFRRFRDALNGMRGGEDSRVAILTPGPMTDTYYEHAYIARYLGFMLLEGEDMMVENGRVMVRTVAGPKPVSVLWRRLDSAFADPLELDPASHLGTAGMVGALRGGQVAMVNALGSGVLEARALMAFMPRLCRALRGEPLKLSNIATWWCGQAAERGYVARHAERMKFGPALSNRLFFEEQAPARREGEALADWLEARGAALVGQEAVTLSTTPAWDGTRLVPRPMSLRVFLARTPEGWAVMPGGYARIGRHADTAAVAMQSGGSVADVWVVADEPVAAETMVPPTTGPFRRTELSVLPARAADNLFWLGRYVERVETVVRLLRAYHLRLAETDRGDQPLLTALADFLDLHGVSVDEPFAAVIAARLASARGCAAQVRDRFSIDGWAALGDLAEKVADLGIETRKGDDAARVLGLVLRRIAGFSGLVHENMYRFTGWRFLTLGRALERANAMAWTLAVFADAAAPEGALDLAVEVGDSLMTHRRRYAVATTRETVIDLLALDDRNPRSILYQFDLVRDQVGRLPGNEPGPPLTPLARRVLEVHTGLAVATPEALTTAELLALRQAMAEVASLVTASYFG